MACPICGCTEIERRQFAGIAELQEQVASLRLTDEEREAVAHAASRLVGIHYAVTLRSLLERTRPDA